MPPMGSAEASGDNVEMNDSLQKSSAAVATSLSSPFLNQPVKKYLENRWATGVVSNVVVMSDKNDDSDHTDDPEWFTAIRKERPSFVVTFDGGLTKEFPGYILESMIALAKVTEGTKIALYSYEIDDFFHAMVKEVDDSKDKNISVEFENRRQEWLDLRRFKYHLVNDDKGQPNQSKVDAPAEKQPDEMEVDDKPSATEEEKKVESTDSQQADKSPKVDTEEKAIQTEAEKCKTMETEDTGIQTDALEELCSTEEKGMQTEQNEEEKADTEEKKAQTPDDTPVPESDSKGVQATAETSSVGVETSAAAAVDASMQTEDTEKEDSTKNTPVETKELQQGEDKADTTKSLDTTAQPTESSMLSNMKTLKIVLEHKGVVVGEKVIGEGEMIDDKIPDSILAAVSSPIGPASSSPKDDGSDGVPVSGKGTNVEGALKAANATEEVKVPMKPLKAPKLKKVVKGTKLAVFWENDGEYYAATVQAVRRAKKRSAFTLEYDHDKYHEQTMLASREFYLLDDFLEVEKYLESTRKLSGALPADNIKRMKKEEEARQLAGKKQYEQMRDPFVRFEMDDDKGRIGDLDKGRKNTISMVEIGTRVAVWWHGEHRFYKGTVSKERMKGKIKQHHIEYDDGDTQWVNFDNLAFFILAQREPTDREADLHDESALDETATEGLASDDGLHDTEDEEEVVEKDGGSAKKSKKRKGTEASTSRNSEDRIPKKSDSQKRKKLR